MKPNTPKFLCVPCDRSEKISLVGVTDHTATFIASRVTILSDDEIKKHIAASHKINNGCIITKPIETDAILSGTETIIIFQRNFDGTLRNPRGFLKATRRLLNGILRHAHAEYVLYEAESDIADYDAEQEDDEYEDEDGHAYDEYCERKGLCPRCSSPLGECCCGYYEEIAHFDKMRQHNAS